jgi:hypothetical protein
VEAPDPGATVIAQAPVACSDLGRSDADACVSARVSVLAADRLGSETAGPELVLRAEDAAGYVSRFRWRTRVAPASTGPVEEPSAPVLIERLLGRLRER